MTIYEKCKAKLLEHPAFRERAKRNKFLMVLTLRDLQLEYKFNADKLTIDEMVDVSKKFDSFRHEYDAVLKDCPDLRGSDYSDKDKLEQEKMVEFGYEVGYKEFTGKR